MEVRLHQPTSPGQTKGKLAIYWAASCGGCEIAILQIDAKILDVANAFDIVLWPCAADGKVRDVEKMADGRSTSASSTAASAPASRNTWPN